jgi:hypothetical protein
MWSEKVMMVSDGRLRLDICTAEGWAIANESGVKNRRDPFLLRLRHEILAHKLRAEHVH